MRKSTAVPFLTLCFAGLLAAAETTPSAPTPVAAVPAAVPAKPDSVKSALPAKTVKAKKTKAVTAAKDSALPHLPVNPGDLKAKVGKPFLEDLLFLDRRYLLQLYGNSGYVRAQADDKVYVKPASHSVRVDYLVQPSYPVIFDTLIIINRRAAPADSLLPEAVRECAD